MYCFWFSNQLIDPRHFQRELAMSCPFFKEDFSNLNLKMTLHLSYCMVAYVLEQQPRQLKITSLMAKK